MTIITVVQCIRLEHWAIVSVSLSGSISHFPFHCVDFVRWFRTNFIYFQFRMIFVHLFVCLFVSLLLFAHRLSSFHIRNVNLKLTIRTLTRTQTHRSPLYAGFVWISCRLQKMSINYDFVLGKWIKCDPKYAASLNTDPIKSIVGWINFGRTQNWRISCQFGFQFEFSNTFKHRHWHSIKWVLNDSLGWF